MSTQSGVTSLNITKISPKIVIIWIVTPCSSAESANVSEKCIVLVCMVEVLFVLSLILLGLVTVINFLVVPFIPITRPIIPLCLTPAWLFNPEDGGDMVFRNLLGRIQNFIVTAVRIKFNEYLYLPVSLHSTRPPVPVPSVRVHIRMSIFLSFNLFTSYNFRQPNTVSTRDTG